MLYKYALEKYYQDQYGSSLEPKYGVAFDHDSDFKALTDLVNHFAANRSDPSYFHKLDATVQAIDAVGSSGEYQRCMTFLSRMANYASEYQTLEESFPKLFDYLLSPGFADLFQLLALCQESYLLVSLSKNPENENPGDVDARMVKVGDFLSGKVTIEHIRKWREEHEGKQKDTNRRE